MDFASPSDRPMIPREAAHTQTENSHAGRAATSAPEHRPALVARISRFWAPLPSPALGGCRLQIGGYLRTGTGQCQSLIVTPSQAERGPYLGTCCVNNASRYHG